MEGHIVDFYTASTAGKTPHFNPLKKRTKYPFKSLKVLSLVA